MGWKSELLRTTTQTISPVVSKLRFRSRRSAGLAAPTTRRRFLQRIDRTHGVLEIGPFYCPQLTGEHVSYFDVLDREQLRSRAAELGWNPETCPDIDYVSPSGDMSVVDRRFGAIFSSHCVEHQPDLVGHLHQIERMLDDGGSYYLIIPDKRFCFDHFLSTSHLGEVCEAYLEKRRHHTAGSIMSHRLLLAHNHALLHWVGHHGRAAVSGDIHGALAESERSINGEYIDVHA